MGDEEAVVGEEQQAAEQEVVGGWDCGEVPEVEVGYAPTVVDGKGECPYAAAWTCGKREPKGHPLQAPPTASAGVAGVPGHGQAPRSAKGWQQESEGDAPPAKSEVVRPGGWGGSHWVRRWHQGTRWRREDLGVERDVVGQAAHVDAAGSYARSDPKRKRWRR